MTVRQGTRYASTEQKHRQSTSDSFLSVLASRWSFSYVHPLLLLRCAVVDIFSAEISLYLVRVSKSLSKRSRLIESSLPTPRKTCESFSVVLSVR